MNDGSRIRLEVKPEGFKIPHSDEAPSKNNSQTPANKAETKLVELIIKGQKKGETNAEEEYHKLRYSVSQDTLVTESEPNSPLAFPSTKPDQSDNLIHPKNLQTTPVLKSIKKIENSIQYLKV